MSDAVGAREGLTEACVDECRMNSGEACRFNPKIDDHVDIISGSRVERSTFDLEQEDHLSTNQQAMVTEAWCQLDAGAPRILCRPASGGSRTALRSDIVDQVLRCDPVPWIS